MKDGGNGGSADFCTSTRAQVLSGQSWPPVAIAGARPAFSLPLYGSVGGHLVEILICLKGQVVHHHSRLMV